MKKNLVCFFLSIILFLANCLGTPNALLVAFLKEVQVKFHFEFQKPMSNC